MSGGKGVSLKFVFSGKMITDRSNKEAKNRQCKAKKDQRTIVRFIRNSKTIIEPTLFNKIA